MDPFNSRKARKIHTYVGLDAEELAIVRRVQQQDRCSRSAAVRSLIRAAEAVLISAARPDEKENQGS